MNKKYAKVQSTRRSLIMSILSLMLCFAMLLGTTYAWFTDSVTSGRNKIIAGNLDIELEYLDGEGKWKPVTESTKLFSDSALWEPGYTEVAYLKLSNKGTLALKYNFAINVANEVSGTNAAGETFKLSDYIKMGVVENWNGAAYTDRAAAREAVTAAGNITTFTDAGYMHKDSVAKTFAIVVYMPEEVGNVANYKTGTTAPSIELGVTVKATQYTEESDSFDKYYDVMAAPIDVYDADEFTKAIAQTKDGDTINVMTADLDLTVAYTDAKTVTLKGEKINKLTADIPNGTIHVYNEVDTVIGTSVDLMNSAHFYNNVKTLNATAGHFVVEVGAAVETIVTPEVVNKNLKIEVKGTVAEIEVPKADTKVTVDVEENATVTKLNITDTTDGAKIVLYNDGTVGNESEVEAKTSAFSGNDEANKVLAINNDYELRAFAEGAGKGKFKQYTVTLTQDIDLAGKAWTPIDGWDESLNGIIFDGNNHSIKNMTVYNDAIAGFIGRNASTITVKNLTFDGANVSTKKDQRQSYAGVLIGKNYSTLTVENVNVKNSTINNNWQCGGIIGFSEGCTVTFKGCTVADTMIGGSSATAGTLFGLGQVDVNVENCSANNVLLCTDSLTWDSTAKAEGNFWVGHLYGNKLIATGLNAENGVIVLTEVADGFYADGATYAKSNTFYITNKSGLKYFADMTNRTVTPDASFGAPDTTSHMFSGKTVKLAANIDLNNEQWTPIGYNKNNVGGKAMFAGTFEGNGYTIKNLYVNNKTVTTKNDYLAGLFGSLNSAVTVKDLTIENAKIYNAYSYAGALAGQTYNSGAKISNVKVCGDIDITAANHAGALVGYSNGTFENCTVDVNAGSKVTSAWHIGGLISLANPNTVVKNCSVKGVTLITTSGGAAGIAGYYKDSITVTGCSVSDVSIVMPDANVAAKAGAIIGFTDVSITSNTIEKNVVTNVTINGNSIN